MLKILKQLTRGTWKDDAVIQKVVNKKPRKRKSSTKSREDLISDFLKSIHGEIKRNGSKRITASRLFNKIGVKKRSPKAILQLNRILSEHGYFISPEISMEMSWKATITFKKYPERQLGNLFARERTLEKYIEANGFYKKLGVDTVKSQHEPDGTRDRFDFLGQTGEQRIVLELKKKDGGKSAVEQVFRYAGYLKREHNDIRKILVTGVQNRETALAIKGQSPQERETFEWYLYDYDEKTGNLDFVRVTEMDIENQLNTQIN